MEAVRRSIQFDVFSVVGCAQPCKQYHWPMINKKAPMTNTEKVRALRERRAADGVTELRGLFVPTVMHQTVKAMVRAFLAQTKKNK